MMLLGSLGGVKEWSTTFSTSFDTSRSTTRSTSRTTEYTSATPVSRSTSRTTFTPYYYDTSPQWFWHVDNNNDDFNIRWNGSNTASDITPKTLTSYTVGAYTYYKGPTLELSFSGNDYYNVRRSYTTTYTTNYTSDTLVSRSTTYDTTFTTTFSTSRSTARITDWYL